MSHYYERNCLAKALYDNVSEAPDELTFRKGDILTVLEQNSNGLEGWWLCSLKGRQGIAPGNRLRLIPGRFNFNGLSCAPSLSLNELQNVSNNPPSFNRFKQLSSNKAFTEHTFNSNLSVNPSKMPDVHHYDVPPINKLFSVSDQSYGNLNQFSKSVNNIDLLQSTVSIVKRPSSLKSFTSKNESKNKENHFLCDFNKNLTTYDFPPPIPRPVKNEDIELIGHYNLPPPLRFKDPISLTKSVNENVSESNSSNKLVPQQSKGSSLISSEASNRSSISISSYDESKPSSLKHSLAELSLNHNNKPIKQQFNCDKQSSFVQKTNQSNCEMKNQVKNTKNISKDSEQDKKNNLYDIPNSLLFNGKSFLNDNIHVKINPLTSLNGKKKKLGPIFHSAPNLVLDEKSTLSPELFLNEEESLETAIRLEQQCYDDIEVILNITQTPQWRALKNFSYSLPNLEKHCKSFRSTFKELIDFGDKIFSNTLKTTEKSINVKLYKLVLQLKNSHTIIESTMKELDIKGWILKRLAHPNLSHFSSSLSGSTKALDELDQLVACIKGLTQDIKHFISYIKSNINQLFQKVTTQFIQLPATPSRSIAVEKPPIGPKPDFIKNNCKPLLQNANNSQLRPLTLLSKIFSLDEDNELPIMVNSSQSSNNDYEYIDHSDQDDINLKSKSYFTSTSNVTLISKFNTNQQAKDTENAKQSNSAEKLNLKNISQNNDEQIFEFYYPQLLKQKKLLTNAINSFLFALSQNESPRLFIEQSKCVVIAGQNLIFIGDTLSRNLSFELNEHFMNCSNLLCDSLKNLVLSVKKASQQFPSGTAIQEMIESLVQVSIQTDKFRINKELKTKTK